MLFNSFTFMVFLPLVLAGFAACPVGWRWAWLLVASGVFYAWLAPVNLLYVGAVGLATYGFGWGIGQAGKPWQRRALLTIALLAILGSLTAFKLYDFVAGELEMLFGWPGHALPRLGVTAPAGYSFYAFSAASYIVDVYVRRLEAARHAGHVALYIAYFPKLLAGPIERISGERKHGDL